jgi:hypothetical protein
MEQSIANFLSNYGWLGFIIAVALLLATNPSSTGLFNRIIDRTKKSETEIDSKKYKKFELIKFKRSSNTRDRVIVVGSNLIVLFFFFFAIIESGKKDLGTTILVLSYIGILYPIWNLLLVFSKTKVERTQEIKGNSDEILRTYQKMIFDMNMFLQEFDMKEKKIKASLNGNELSIEIIPINNGENNIKITSIRSISGVFFHSGEFEKNIRTLINMLSYPQN